MHRVLETGGRVVVANYSVEGTGLSRIAMGLFSFIHRHWPSLIGTNSDLDIVRRLEGAGFKVESRDLVTNQLVVSEVVVAISEPVVG